MLFHGGIDKTLGIGGQDHYRLVVVLWHRVVALFNYIAGLASCVVLPADNLPVTSLEENDLDIKVRRRFKCLRDRPISYEAVR